MPDDQNLNNQNLPQPQPPVSSWSPETDTTSGPIDPASGATPTPQAPVSNPLPPPIIETTMPVTEPVAVKPPVMKSPDEQEVFFKPQPIEEILKEQQTEALQPDIATSEKKEGLTLTELASRYYKRKDQIEAEEERAVVPPDSLVQNQIQQPAAAVAPVLANENLSQNTEEAAPPTLSEPSDQKINGVAAQAVDAAPLPVSPEVHESGHFTSLPGTENIDTSTEEEIFKNIKTDNTNPSPDSTSPSIASPNASPPTVEPTVMPVNPENFNAEAPQKKGKAKKIILGVFIPLLIVGLGIGGYFGWIWWEKYNTVRVLDAAAKNLAAGGAMQVDYKAGFNGFSNSGKVSIDSEGDFNASTNIESMPIDITFIKSEDKIYFAGPEEQYLVYTNVSSSLESLSKEETDTSLGNSFNSENVETLKYLKTVGREDINGIKTTHYYFDPPAEYLDSEINSKEELKSLGAKITKLTMEVWVGNEDQKVYRIKMNFVYGGFENMQQNTSGISLDEMDINLELNFNYNYTENLAAPQNPKVMGTYDMSKAIDPSNPGALLPST